MWENYKEQAGNAAAGFDLVNGRGYLYATKTTKTLTFTGEFNLGTSKELSGLPTGYNLVGNPFVVDAYVNKPYYTLNSDGSSIVAKNSNEDQRIAPCYGVIVEVIGSENVIFNTTGQFSAGPNNGGLQVALTQANTRSNTVMDNAIVSFNEGSELGKFYFGEQNANIYLPQNGKDYAIAFSEGQGEMPVNFKAKKNGSYTITVNPEGVEMAYLHLIDNIAGQDVDLLAHPSYTFNARRDDYASRFKLVFRANQNDNDNENENFGFISNGNLMILGIEGKATLQIIDVTGRILSTETFYGNYNKAVNAKAGLYMLRLIQGENVRTQKIVVR